MITKESSLKTLAKHLIKYNGCHHLDCHDCPLGNKTGNVYCTLSESPDRALYKETSIIDYTRIWAEDYLQKLEKLEYLEKLK